MSRAIASFTVKINFYHIKNNKKMKTKSDIIAILKDMAEEFNIVRAGRLATKRINDKALKLLQDHPALFDKQQSTINSFLDFRSEEQKIINVLSNKIEEIKKELDSPEESIDVLEMIQRIYQLL